MFDPWDCPMIYPAWGNVYIANWKDPPCYENGKTMGKPWDNHGKMVIFMERSTMLWKWENSRTVDWAMASSSQTVNVWSRPGIPSLFHDVSLLRSVLPRPLMLQQPHPPRFVTFRPHVSPQVSWRFAQEPRSQLHSTGLSVAPHLGNVRVPCHGATAGGWKSLWLWLT